MQQFARRPEPDQPQNTPKPTLSTDSVTQLLDQLTELTKTVSEIKEEIASVRSENQRLRLQVTGLLGSHEPSEKTAAPEPIKATEVAKVEAPVIAKKQVVEQSVDEEFLVDLVRASGVKEQDVRVKPEEPVESAAPMSDDDIQRMLADAALGAFDAAKLDWETKDEVVEPVQVAAEPVTIEEPETVPVLHLIDDAPVEVERYKVAIDFDLDHAVLARVPANLAIAALAVPHRMEGSKLVCKVAQPYDYPSLAIIADAAACEVVPEPAMIEQVLAALRVAYSDDSRDTEKDALWSVAATQPQRKRGLFRRSA